MREKRRIRVKKKQLIVKEAGKETDNDSVLTDLPFPCSLLSRDLFTMNDKNGFTMNDKNGFIMNDELVATCSALGKVNTETGKYEKSEDCEACLLDLLRFMKNDDTRSLQTKQFVVRRSLAQVGVVVNDLIPILNEYGLDDPSLFKVLTHMLQNISAPTILLFEEKLPQDKLEKQRYLELVEINRSIKIAFGSSKAIKTWSVFAKYMTEYISLSWENRDDDQKSLFQRMLLLVRNLLHIPLDSAQDRSVEGELNPQDRLVSVLDKAGILDIILLLVSSEDEVSEFCFHILEITSALLREQSPEFLAKCFDPANPDVDLKARSTIERETDDHELGLLVAKEKEKYQRVKPFYSRFKEATFQVTNLKSLSDKSLIVHKIPQNLEFTTLGYHKGNSMKARNRVDLLDPNFSSGGPSGIVSRSPPGISRILSKFCHEFLKSYNDLMMVTEMNLARSKENRGDETYYLWASAFFMEFNRFSNPDVTLVSSTFSVKALHDFHTHLDSCLEKLKAEKKVHIPWSRRLHYALRAYRELIFTLAFSDSSKSQEFAQVTKGVKISIFYEDDYRDLLLMLIKDFNPVKMTRSYLVDLVLTNHLFLKLLKVYCASQPKVEVKARKKKEKEPKKKEKELKKKKEKELKKKKDERVDLNEFWENLETGLMAALDGLVLLPSAEEDEDVMPLDPTVDFEPDVQKLAIAQRLNRLLKEGKPSTAVALLRNAREAWPEDEENLFGSKGASVEEEMTSLKNILMFEIVPPVEEVVSEEEGKSGSDQEGKSGSDQEEKSGSDQEGKSGSDQEEEKETSRKSNQLTFQSVFKKYCNTKVIQAHSLLLKNFENNSMETNHAIVKLFHRMAVDLDLYGMFFQASLFRIFQKVLKTNESNESTKELVQFAKFIVKKFVATVPKNDMLLVELLFWKTAAQAIQLDTGYDDSKPIREEDDTGYDDSKPIREEDFPVEEEDLKD